MSVLVRPAFEERVLMVNDGGWLSEDDGHGIEPDLIPRDTGLCGVSAGGSDYVPLFVCINGPIRGAKLGRTAGLHLDKHDNVAVPSDNVHLSFAAARTVIPGKHREPGATQVAMRIVFTPPAESRFRCQAATVSELSGRVAYFPEQLPRYDGPG